MKKILLTFLIFITYTWYAFWECSIKTQTPKELTDYIQKTSTIANNLSTNWQKIVWQKYSWLSDDEIIEKRQKLRNEVIKWLNITYWWWKEYEFDFTNLLEILKEKERPISIKRDLKLIDYQIEIISKYISNSTKQLYGWEILKKDKICNWIDSNYDIWEYKINSLLIEIKTNLTKIRKAILNNWKIEWLLLFDNENKLKYFIEVNYSRQNIEECMMEKSAFWWKINTYISEISINNKNYERGLQKWKEGWDMLIWAKVDTGIEKRILLNELRKQGISENGIENILSNLNNYNYNWWYNFRDNFFSNTYLNIIRSVKKEINSFNASMKKYFIEEDLKQVDVNKFLNNKDKIVTVNLIEEKINRLYLQNSSVIQNQDQDTQNIMTRLAKMHIYIASSITTAQKTIPISEKVCNEQCTWKWNCTY